VQVSRRCCWVLGGILIGIVLLLRARGGDHKYTGQQLVLVAIQAAEAGGAAVRGGPGLQKSKGRTAEGADDPLTEADLRSHCAMSAALRAAFPAAHLISEETPSPAVCSRDPIPHPQLHPDTSLIDLLEHQLIPADDITIWIDPLDATQEYTGTVFHI